jgi:hypothetical protein
MFENIVEFSLVVVNFLVVCNLDFDILTVGNLNVLDVRLFSSPYPENFDNACLCHSGHSSEQFEK